MCTKEHMNTEKNALLLVTGLFSSAMDTQYKGEETLLTVWEDWHRYAAYPGDITCWVEHAGILHQPCFFPDSSLFSILCMQPQRHSYTLNHLFTTCNCRIVRPTVKEAIHYTVASSSSSCRSFRRISRVIYMSCSILWQLMASCEKWRRTADIANLACYCTFSL